MKQAEALSAVSPTQLVLFSIVSTQLGAAIAKGLFDVLPPAAVVLLRVGFAAIVLLALWRPPIQAIVRRHYLALIGFGLALALMNFTFYLAIERIPIGIAVTLEFVGPLGVAIAHSRRLLDGLWVLLAGCGIMLLAPIGGSTLDPMGVVWAAIAGGCWAIYILLSAKVGQALAGGTGLAIAMGIGAIALLPFGIAAGGTALLNPQLLLMGFGVALLSSALPYSFELEALRWMPMQVFGVLLSLEPVAAAIIGFVVLQETLDTKTLIAILLVSVAAAGSSRYRTTQLT